MGTTDADHNWTYVTTVREHFFNPRNLLEDDSDYHADGIGEFGAMACGDVMKVWISVENGYITDCKWRTFGCASAIASMSMLSVMVLEHGGMTLEDALKIRPNDILTRLGGLPANKVHCSVLGDRVLRDAIADYYQRQGDTARAAEIRPAPEKESADSLVCICRGVRTSDIQKAVEEGATTLKDIQEQTGATTVCNSCREVCETFLAQNPHTS